MQIWPDMSSVLDWYSPAAPLFYGNFGKRKVKSVNMQVQGISVGRESIFIVL